MRRWFLVLMLVLLPLQFSWAAAGAYCQHQQPHAAQHVGHHFHKHTPSNLEENKSEGAGMIESDCGVCHAGGSLAFQTGNLLPALSTDFLRGLGASLVPPAHFQDLPDRPQWLPLA